ncbi:MbcA/ParS/Xre antitoxin family protein [Acerihabitans sp.]|uniref:MbcA/ParS/Xre antitoxin family protein n=1 Tax=Acerihabitans sp. TaxID=2811394 RepID=UPI002EDA94BA
MSLPQKLPLHEDKRHAAAVGLKTVMAILDKWGASPEQAQSILQISKASYYKFRKDPAAALLTNDQLERLSYLLNIHASLRTLFENPENVYGFMSLNNHNPYFNGRRPLDMLSTGHFGTLYEVHKQLDALRGGQW